jgi:hypothetical protein
MTLNTLSAMFSSNDDLLESIENAGKLCAKLQTGREAHKHAITVLYN